MTEKEVKQLLKLLDKFANSRDRDGGGNLVEMNSIVSAARQWVIWYGRDELGMELR